jgi:hypothetical protein
MQISYLFAENFARRFPSKVAGAKGHNWPGGLEPWEIELEISLQKS